MKTTYRNKSLFILLLILLSCFSQLYAQEKTKISLSDAIEMSLANSKHLKISQSKMELAGLKIKEIRNNQLPSLGLSASYLRINSSNLKLKFGGGSGEDSTGSAPGFPHINQAMYGMVNASIPIFNGFRFKYGIESAKFLEQASKLDSESDKEAIVLNTIGAYTNLFNPHCSQLLVIY